MSPRDARTLPEGTQVFLGEPAEMPAGVLEAVADACRPLADVAAAYRAWMYVQLPDEQPHLAVGLVVDDGADLDRILDAVDAAIAPTGAQVSLFVIRPDHPGAVDGYMLDQTEPFCARPHDVGR